MSKIIIAGLTGRSGSGKTTVANIMMQKGIPVISADLAARKVVAPCSPCLEKIKKYFGGGVIRSDGTLNRRKLAAIAFQSNEKTELLNHITHSYILEDINKTIKEHAKAGHKMVILDASQLFESGADKICDVTVAVVADAALEKQRIIERDDIDEITAQNRLDRQHTNEFFIKNTDYVIYNNSTLDRLNEEIEKAVEFCKAKIKK